MCKLNINVFFQNNDYVKRMEQRLVVAEKQVVDAEAARHVYAFECVSEKRVNLELIDLLRTNGIRYRTSADISKWEK